jgi:hypothetical protein
MGMEPSSLVWLTSARVESQLELPTGFLDALVSEDDWSFIGKLSSLPDFPAAWRVVECPTFGSHRVEKDK